jgi:hypothetical protein
LLHLEKKKKTLAAVVVVLGSELSEIDSDAECAESRGAKDAVRGVYSDALNRKLS